MLSACAPSDGDPLAVRVDTLPGGIERVQSDAPIEPGRWALIEELRVVSPDTGAGVIGMVRDVALTPDGTMLVADLDPVTVHVFGPDGRWLRDIGRQGSGPGEFEDAFLAVIGDTVFVQDRRNSRVNRYLLDGTVLPSLASACCMTDGIGVAAGDRVLVPVPGPPDGSRRWVVAAAGTPLDTLTLVDERIRQPPFWSVTLPGGGGFGKLVPWVPVVRTASDPAGSLVTGWSGEYLLRRTSSGRDTTLLYGRAIGDRQAFTDADRDRIADELVRSDATLEGVPEEVLRSAYDPGLLPSEPELFDRIWVDPVGRTWVQRVDTSLSAVRIDLFDPQGRWLDVLEVARDGWPTAAFVRPVAWSRQGVLVAVEGEAGPEVVRYRIARTEAEAGAPDGAPR
jgi:hypothetical protein